MTATTATDASGVQYYFYCLTAGGHSSAWQASPTYMDTGLSPGTTYKYEVKTRDESSNHNQGNYSPAVSATTLQPPPAPNPSQWATLAYPTSATSISMTAKTAKAAAAASGVQYYFHNMTIAGHDSGWQASPTYVDTGLSPGTKYKYEVKTRDKSLNHNMGNYSTPKSATTLPAATHGTMAKSVGAGTILNKDALQTAVAMPALTTSRSGQRQRRGPAQFSLSSSASASASTAGIGSPTNSAGLPSWRRCRRRQTRRSGRQGELLR